jgi:sucrose 6(F)-phosphate phosphorylase
MEPRNQVQLITYPDSFGGNLQGLDRALRMHFPGVFPGGIHILPPFPSSGDRGFAPLTYMEIDPRFGTWADVRRFGESSGVMLDLMVNHISRQSPWFKDFLKNGRRSEYADLFITLDKLWPGGKPSDEDLSPIFLRRPSPFSGYTIQATGREETLWTTFGKQNPSEQIDMDWTSGVFRGLLERFMANFSANNVRMVRLDAVGYVIKKVGTSCFFVEPEIWQFLEWIKGLADSYGILLLPEVHGGPATQLSLSEHGYWIYDFILPYTVLEALVKRDAGRLKRYLATRPHRQFTMLDCHDGIPVKPDLEGLYKSGDVREVVRMCVERGANLSRVLSPKHKDPDGFDVHQVRCSYYSALGSDDNSYLSARAIQFFAPGIPQVYYAGLLAGENDVEAVERTGEGREINRHDFSAKEIAERAETDVVRRLVKLIRFRNEHPAFSGEFEVLDSPGNVVRLRWRNREATCTLTADLETRRSGIEHSDVHGAMVRYEV